jgi:hypothetical protein
MNQMTEVAENPGIVQAENPHAGCLSRVTRESHVIARSRSRRPARAMETLPVTPRRSENHDERE